MILRHVVRILIALLICAVIWWIGPLFAVGIYRPLTGFWVRLAFVALLLAWALWPLLVWLLRPRPTARRAAVPRQLDRVTARLRDAVRTLRHVGLASQRGIWQRIRYRMRRGYVHDRPWYLVLGPQGVGKSALLRASGQRFLLSEHYGLPATADTGATRDCNVWLADDAVYIDTAGSCMADEGMSADTLSAWSILLRRIRGMRRFPAIDGVVLCLDAAWLPQASMASRKSLADALRGRLLEVAGWFRHDVRVHILVNRLDTLPGIATLLALLPDEVLEDGIGMNLPVTGNLSPGAEVDGAWREFETRLQRQAMTAMQPLSGKEREHARGELLQALERIGELRQPLLDLVEQVFPASPVGFSTRLRSVWFGSAMNVAAADGGTAEPRPLGHVYRRPLQRAISERGWTDKAGRGGWRTRVAGAGAFAAAVLVLVAVGALLGGRYAWEREYIGSAWAGFNEAKRISHDAVAAPHGRDTVVQAADEFRYMAVLLDESYATGANPSLNPYTEHRLVKDSVSRTYRRHLAKVFWPEVERYVARALAEETATTSDELFETLKVYLMLTKPERRDTDALLAWFDRRWDRLAPPGSTVADRGAFEHHLRALFATDGEALPAMQADTSLLRGARGEAASLPLPTRVLSRIRALPLPADIEAVSLASAAGSQVALRRSGETTASETAIPGIFTLAGYRNVFLPHMERVAATALEEGAWVLDDGGENGGRGIAYTTTRQLADHVHRLYLGQYADAWDRFLKDIRIRQVAGLEDAAQLADQLAASSSPLGNVVRFAAAQTTLAGHDAGSVARPARGLEKKGNALIEQLAGSRSPTASLAQTMVDTRFEALHRLAGRGPDDRGADDSLARLFANLADQFAMLIGALGSGQIMPRSDALERLRSEANRQPAPVRGIVNELIHIADTQNLQRSRSRLASSASGVGSGVCARTIAGRYPLDRQAREDIGINDFVNVFGRSGALQTFFDGNLAAYVDTNAHPWRARLNAADGQPLVAAGTVRAFEQAARIRDTFLTDGGKFGFSMIVRPVELDPSVLEASLDIDGQVMQYARGSQQPMRIDWPGPRGGVYARLTLKLEGDRTETIGFEGPWALFRLFDAGSSRVFGPDRRELVLRRAAHAFRIEIRSSTQDSPLWSQALSRFRCPG
jgi:type VI secretion system protein ImpL